MMYQAMLLLCLAANPSQCMQAIDSRGPYDSVGNCQDRLAEMTIDIMTDHRTKNVFFISAVHCMPIDGAKL
jgi:hypothetical protein